MCLEFGSTAAMQIMLAICQNISAVAPNENWQEDMMSVLQYGICSTVSTILVFTVLHVPYFYVLHSIFLTIINPPAFIGIYWHLPARSTFIDLKCSDNFPIVSKITLILTLFNISLQFTVSNIYLVTFINNCQDTPIFDKSTILHSQKMSMTTLGGP